MLFLRLHDHENTAAEILWGLWLLPLAMLVCRSHFLPRFLGVWLTINGFAYVIMSFTGILLPQYQDKVFTISQPALFGELAIMLLLVIKGAKPPALDATGSWFGGGLGCITNSGVRRRVAARQVAPHQPPFAHVETLPGHA
jgi:Domain of unknown function (DUF4386)